MADRGPRSRPRVQVAEVAVAQPSTGCSAASLSGQVAARLREERNYRRGCSELRGSFGRRLNSRLSTCNPLGVAALRVMVMDRHDAEDVHVVGGLVPGPRRRKSNSKSIWFWPASAAAARPADAGARPSLNCSPLMCHERPPARSGVAGAAGYPARLPSQCRPDYNARAQLQRPLPSSAHGESGSDETEPDGGDG